MKKSVCPPRARTRRAKALPAAKRAGASLATALARQLQSFATLVLGDLGTATDEALTLAQSRINRRGTKAAASLGDLRQAAGLTLDDLGQALEVAPSLMGPVEKGQVVLPLELILQLTAVLGRNEPIGFAWQMTRAYNPQG